MKVCKSGPALVEDSIVLMVICFTSTRSVTDVLQVLKLAGEQIMYQSTHFTFHPELLFHDDMFVPSPTVTCRIRWVQYTEMQVAAHLVVDNLYQDTYLATCLVADCPNSRFHCIPISTDCDLGLCCGESAHSPFAPLCWPVCLAWM